MRTLIALGLLTVLHSPASAQETKRFRLGRRYDATHALIYFQAVHLGETMKGLPRIAPTKTMDWPLAGVSPAFVAQYLPASSARFSPGDKYDLLLGNGRAVAATLTTLVAIEGDEEVGNESYLGAIAAANENLSDEFFAVRPHVATRLDSNRPATLRTSVPPSIRTRILPLLAARPNNRKGVLGTCRTSKAASRYRTQTLRLSNGELRYYAQATWSAQPDTTPPGRPESCMVTAWFSPTPNLHLLAIEGPWIAAIDDVTLDLRNVMDLGGGKTGIVMFWAGYDNMRVDLLEYRDGATSKQMPRLAEFSAGE